MCISRYLIYTVSLLYAEADYNFSTRIRCIQLQSVPLYYDSYYIIVHYYIIYYLLYIIRLCLCLSFSISRFDCAFIELNIGRSGSCCQVLLTWGCMFLICGILDTIRSDGTDRCFWRPATLDSGGEYFRAVDSECETSWIHNTHLPCDSLKVKQELASHYEILHHFAFAIE